MKSNLREYKESQPPQLSRPLGDPARPDRPPQVALVLDQINQQLEEQNKLISTLENKLVNVCHQAAKEATGDEVKMVEELVPLAQALTVVQTKINVHNRWITSLINRIEV